MKLTSLPSSQDKTLYLASMVASYLETALWVQFDTEDNVSVEDIALESKMQAIKDCGDFLNLLKHDVRNIEAHQMGHDFYLTRTHQGAGIWDRGHGQFGDHLTMLSHKFSEVTPIIGDDGKVYFE